ncbi:MAG: DUF3306 domain-containing protein [Steroidobacteraceae bacterium]
MSEPENASEHFLQRWSRRKRADAHASEPETLPQDRPQAKAPERAGTADQIDIPGFDPASLPPLDSIGAASDIRAFLAPGVPEELTRAALRRAWVADPAIRDFIGLAENQWDFTDPDNVPGFGRLELTPQLRRMIAYLVGDGPEPTPPLPRLDIGPGAQLPDTSAETDLPANAAGCSGNEPDNDMSVPRRAADVAAPGSGAAVASGSDNGTAVQTTAGGNQPMRRPPRRHGGAIPK